MSISCYRDLEVWQKAMDLVVVCYRAAERFPRMEIYGLSNQLRRAAVSVPANIAEGHGRSHTKEYLNHLSMAYGSLMEVETHLLIAEKLSYLDQTQLAPAMKLPARVGRMLNGLMRALNQKLTQPRIPGPRPPPNDRA